MATTIQQRATTAIESIGLQTAAAETVGMCSERLARIGPAMQHYIDEDKVAGVLSAVARHGKVVHLQAQGYADRESGRELASDSLFRIYSMTKPMTAVVIMQLYEEGRLFLDDPIADYLPEFSTMSVYSDAGLIAADGPITIRHLLLHTSGLTYSMVPNVPAVSALYEQAGLNEARGRLGGHNLAEHVAALAALPLIAQPGTAWHYCEGVSVLARLAEVLTGQRYGELIRLRLFKPLAMKDTGYHVPAQQLPRLASLYEQRPRRDDGQLDGFQPTSGYGGDYGQPPRLEAGGAGLVSSAADCLRFAQMLLNGGELDGVRLLSPTSVGLITANQLGPEFGPQPLASLAPAYRGVGFGFCGLVVTDAVARGGAGSNGEYSWSGWASTRFWIDPAQGVLGLVLTQLIPQPDIVLGLGERMHQMTYQALLS